MREILFRGKREDTGEWVYGYYTEACGTYNVGISVIETKIDDYVVIPETVGQYIGYMDKNDKKVFEGDILECTNPSGRSKRCVIEYEGSSFVYSTPWDERTGICDVIDDHEYGIVIEIREVIGNIYDNPELLVYDAAKENGDA